MNVCSHLFKIILSATVVKNEKNKFRTVIKRRLELLPHPPYSSDLAPCEL